MTEADEAVASCETHLPDEVQSTDDLSTGRKWKEVSNHEPRLLDNVSAIQYGFHLKGNYKHSKKYTDLIASEYLSFQRLFSLTAEYGKMKTACTYLQEKFF